MVTFSSGAVFQILNSDLIDSRLAYLRTALSEAISAQKAKAMTEASVAKPSTSASTSSQSSLPNLENALIVKVRSSRQASTQSPVELTFRSGTHVTVQLQDVHEYATNLVRSNRQVDDPALLFVLLVRSVTSVSTTQSLVTLFSSATFQVPTADITDTRLAFLRTVLSEARNGILPGRSTVDAGDTPSLGSATSVIRVKCASDWPDDFAMRAFCQKRQDESLAALRQRTMNSSADQRTIRTKCEKDWPDDFAMRNFCELRQLEALTVIR
jgi:hypothetical protein